MNRASEVADLTDPDGMATRDDSEMIDDEDDDEIDRPIRQSPDYLTNDLPDDRDRTDSVIRSQPDWKQASQTTNAADTGLATPLLSEFEIDDLRSRWSNVQAGFVDSPRRSVEQADELVAAIMQRLANGFAEERSSLEKQWDRGDSVSTEDLRVALQRYRAFFGRLVNAA